MGVIGVRPLLAQFTEFNHATTMIVVGHPTRNLIGGDGGNEHGDGRLGALIAVTHMIPEPFALSGGAPI